MPSQRKGTKAAVTAHMAAPGTFPCHRPNTGDNLPRGSTCNHHEASRRGDSDISHHLIAAPFSRWQSTVLLRKGSRHSCRAFFASSKRGSSWSRTEGGMGRGSISGLLGISSFQIRKRGGRGPVQDGDIAM